MSLRHRVPFRTGELPVYNLDLEIYSRKPPGLADRKKVATLLTLVGSETYILLKSLLSPQLPSEFTFDEITSKLINHLKPRRLTVAERFKFHQRNQNDGEDVAKFAAELRRLASTLNFGDFITEALRDQFVCGIRNGNTQRKLLSEDFCRTSHADSFSWRGCWRRG